MTPPRFSAIILTPAARRTCLWLHLNAASRRINQSTNQSTSQPTDRPTLSLPQTPPPATPSLFASAVPDSDFFVCASRVSITVPSLITTIIPLMSPQSFAHPRQSEALWGRGVVFGAAKVDERVVLSDLTKSGQPVAALSILPGAPTSALP